MRFAFLLFLMVCSPIFALADGHVPLTRAFEAMKAGDWNSARAIASDVSPVAYDLIEWHRLRAGEGNAQEVMLFLELNPDWPGLAWLRKKSEPAMLDASDEDVLEFFKIGLPQTAQGAFAHARALNANGQSGSAEAGLVLAWRSMEMQGLPIDYANTRNDKVNAVTLEQINRVIKDVYLPDELHFTVVGKPTGLE